MTDDEADWELLRAVDTEDRLAIPIETIMAMDVARALDRAIRRPWMHLIDVAPVPMRTGRVCRIFRLNADGQARLDGLRRRYGAISNPGGN